MQSLELVYTRNNFNLAKIVVLKLFKMAVNQTNCSRLEQGSVIKFSVAETCTKEEKIRLTVS